VVSVALVLTTAQPEASAAAPAAVSVGRERVFDIAAANGAASAEERAQTAQTLLAQFVDDLDAPALVTVDPAPPTGPDDTGSELAVRVDGHEVFRITSDDVRLSGLPAEAYGQSLRASIQTALQRERRHVSQQRFLQSVSLVVFLGLLLFLALRGVREANARLRTVVDARFAKMRGLRLGDLEILSPAALEGASHVAAGAARLLLQLGLIYLYLVFVLMRFSTTRGWVGPLDQALAAPFAKLAARIVDLVPRGLVVLFALIVMLGSLRVADFFVARVARGDIRSSWLPRDLAPTLSPLIRAAIVVAALLLFGPLIGSEQNQLFTRVGLLLLGGVSLALVPLAATALVGVVAIVGRRYRAGEWLTIGTLVGEVTHVGYLGLTLVPPEAGRLWVPHLTMLWKPVRHMTGAPIAELEIPVDLHADPRQVLEILAGPQAKKLDARLVKLTPEAAIYAIRLPAHHETSPVLQAAWVALAAAGIAVGGKGAVAPAPGPVAPAPVPADPRTTAS